MTKPVALSPEEREAAFVDICSLDPAVVCEGAKRLSVDPTTTAQLLALLDTQTRPEVRRGILYGLAWHGDLPLVPELEAMLSDHTPVAGWVGTVATCAAEQIEWLRNVAERRAQRLPPYDGK